MIGEVKVGLGQATAFNAKLNNKQSNQAEIVARTVIAGVQAEKPEAGEQPEPLKEGGVKGALDVEA